MFTPLEKAALTLAEEMSKTPVDVSEQTFDNVRAHFDEPRLVELVATIAMENYRARFNRAFGVEAQGLCQIRGVPLPPAQGTAAQGTAAQGTAAQGTATD